MLFKDGFDNGFNDGFDKGTTKTKLDSARNLLDILNVQVIAERIGLPVETIQKLKDESK